MIKVEFINQTGEVVITTLIPIEPKLGTLITLPNDSSTYEITKINYQVGGTFKVKAQIAPEKVYTPNLPEVVTASDPVTETKNTTGHRPWMIFTITLIVVWLHLIVVVLCKACLTPTNNPRINIIPDSSVTPDASLPNTSTSQP